MKTTKIHIATPRPWRFTTALAGHSHIKTKKGNGVIALVYAHHLPEKATHDAAVGIANSELITAAVNEYDALRSVVTHAKRYRAAEIAFNKSPTLAHQGDVSNYGHDFDLSITNLAFFSKKA